MGEIADELVDGFRCRCCGEVIDEGEPGHSRLCRRCKADQSPPPTTGLTFRQLLQAVRAGNVSVAMIAANLSHPEPAISLAVRKMIASGLLTPFDAQGHTRLTKRAARDLDRNKKGHAFVPPKSKKILTWLKLSNMGSGMYPGERIDFAPRVFDRLIRDGLCSLYIPHNPVHKERAVATERGREVLKKAGLL